MGYHITLSRPESSKGISAQEWKDFVSSRPELKFTGEETHFITAILDGDEILALHYSLGDCSVFTKNPEGPRIIEYMASIAPHFAGIVTGDDGEVFSSAADWGNQSDWDRPMLRKSFWRRDFTLGNIIRMALLLFVLLLFGGAPILKYFFPRH